MSAALTDRASETHPRVLVLGRSRDVMDAVLQDLGDAGVAATGSIRPGRALQEFGASGFDLIAFGGGLKGELVRNLKAQFAKLNSRTRFLDTSAPVAAWQIIETLNGNADKPRVGLDAYCNRIGYRGPRTPTLNALQALCELQPAAIPFEAIDALLDHGIDISPPAVDAKLIGKRRGGYCYEQNSLLRRVLETMGFHVESLIARVRWSEPAGSPLPPRSHMALRVSLDGEQWLVDAGFGGYMPTAPLRMNTAEPQKTRHETYRIIPFANALLLQMRQGERWEALYEFSSEPQFPVDFESPNWFTATHPDSLFRRNLIVAKSTPRARYRLLDNRLSIQSANGQVERLSLGADEIEKALAETFRLPVEPSWRPAIERAAVAEHAE